MDSKRFMHCQTVLTDSFRPCTMTHPSAMLTLKALDVSLQWQVKAKQRIIQPMPKHVMGQSLQPDQDSLPGKIFGHKQGLQGCATYHRHHHHPSALMATTFALAVFIVEANMEALWHARASPISRPLNLPGHAANMRGQKRF